MLNAWAWMFTRLSAFMQWETHLYELHLTSIHALTPSKHLHILPYHLPSFSIGRLYKNDDTLHFDLHKGWVRLGLIATNCGAASDKSDY